MWVDLTSCGWTLHHVGGPYIMWADLTSCGWTLHHVGGPYIMYADLTSCGWTLHHVGGPYIMWADLTSCGLTLHHVGAYTTGPLQHAGVVVAVAGLSRVQVKQLLQFRSQKVFLLKKCFIKNKNHLIALFGCTLI